MSWLYSRALVEEYSAGNCSDGGPFAPSSLMNTPAMFLSQGKTMEASNLSRYGMMCEPLTESRGEDVLTLFLEDFPVRILVQQEKALELTANGLDSGGKWQGLLVKYDQDMFSSKTVLCSEQEDYQLFSKTLPKQGMMHDGECSGLAMWERPINARECGYLPTVTKVEWKGRGPNSRQQGLTNRLGITGKQLHPDYCEALMGWPIGWTELSALETGKFRRWLDLHGKL